MGLRIGGRVGPVSYSKRLTGGRRSARSRRPPTTQDGRIIVAYLVAAVLAWCWFAIRDGATFATVAAPFVAIPGCFVVLLLGWIVGRLR